VDPAIPDLQHVLASNITQLTIVASFQKPEIKWGLIDRMLVAGEQQGVKIAIVLNKMDLLVSLDKPLRSEYEQEVQYYKDLGYRVFQTQANSVGDPGQNDLKELIAAHQNELTIITGHSGVGKSSIINCLGPRQERIVDEDEVVYKGRHTTSYSCLLPLNTGGFVVDTPGIRSFGLEKQGCYDLSWAFRDLRPFMDQCRFGECSHQSEPSCAVINPI
jgi:ribosome biogenesis GTPase